MLYDAERWPEWWRGVQRVVELDPDDVERVGSRYRVSWRSRIPYEVEFDFTVRRVEAPRLMEGEAAGELIGTGCWRLFEQDGLTAVTYDWNVRAGATWMRLLDPVARPAFAWNHDVVMRWGGQGLARELGGALVAAG